MESCAAAYQTVTKWAYPSPCRSWRLGSVKILERLFEVLPIPLLVAGALLCVAAWITKEVRSLGSYGATLRDTHFQTAAFLVLVALVGFYGTRAIWRFRVPGVVTGRALFVAEFDGDVDGLVQKHTVETLQKVMLETTGLQSVRVRPLHRKHDTDSAKSNTNLTRCCLVYGTFIPPSTVHYKYMTAAQDLEGRITVYEYPKIESRLTPPIVASIVRAPEGLVEQSLVLRELSNVRSENEQLLRELAQNRRLLRELRLQSSASPQELEMLGKVRDYYQNQRKFLLAIGVNAYQKLPTLVSAVPDAELINEVFRTQLGLSQA